MDLLKRLLEHDRWATNQLLELSRDLSNEQLDSEFDIGYQSLRVTFAHMIATIPFWHGLMTGQRIDPRREGQRHAGSIATLSAFHSDVHEAFTDFAIRARNENRLDETFEDHWGERPTIGGTILQVILHNTEHRTEAAHILQRLGAAEGIEVDHLLWEHTTKPD